MEQVAEAKPDTRACTCHPDDAPVPCPRKFATNHCWRAAVYAETWKMVIDLKNRDRQPREQVLLEYLMQVERALDGSF
jgi:hypothetical protein